MTRDEDLHRNPPDSPGGTSIRFDVFAFSAPPRTGDRTTSRNDGVPRELSSARWVTPMSLATPHSEPPITPHEGQTLPLPLPAHAQLPWTRSTAASQSIDSVILDISTGQRFPDSNPRRLDQEPPSATVFHGVPATATEAGSSSGTIPMKEIEPQGPGSQDPETLMPRAMAEIEEHVEDDSPYPIVRACVSNTDDPDMPIMTLRMWAVGLTLNILGGCINLFLNLRYPSIYLTNAILVVVAFVIGKILERIMPIRLWIIPSWIPLIGDRSFCLNPGPFNIKEHGLICMMTGDLISTPYGLNLVLTARKYYNLSLGPSFSFCLYTSALVLPISFGWITRKLFVYPSSKLWPTNLALSAVLNAFHAGDAKKGNHDLTRLRFFTIVMILYAFYHFLPGFLFTALSYFSFVCWIRPNNVVVNQLFGAATGLGMSLLSFDWFQIALIGSPMIIPWTVSAHIFAGFVTFYWILLPILYYTDTWNTGHLPIMGLSAYDRFAQPYDLNRVLNPDKTLNVTAYEEYPVYIPIGFVMTYLVAFIFTTTLVVATALDYGKEVLGVAQSKSVENDDIHARLMKRYPEIPGAWSAGVLLVSLGLAITAIKIADLDTPVWALFLAMAISFVYSIPALYIYSYSGKAPTMNLTFELVAGSIWRGRPLALMTFKIISVQWLLLGVSFIENLKLGHYLKIPPRSTFTVQIVAAIVVSATQVGLQEWIFNTVQDLCEADQKGFLICPTTGVFYTASILWGAIGPKLLFRRGFLQSIEIYGLVAGSVIPFVVWAWRKSAWGMRFPPFSIVLFLMCNDLPPGTGLNYSSWFLVAFITQYWVRTRHTGWWLRYNYILSGALGAGAATGAVLVFVLLQLPKSGTVSLNWWGNTVWMNTADASGVPYLPTDPDMGF